MADESIKRLIELGVNATPAVQELEKLRASAEKQTAAVDDLNNRLQKYGSIVTKAFALDVFKDAALAVLDRIGGIIDSFDELNKRAQGVGTTVEKLQELEYAADLAGVSSEKMSKALVTLSEKIVTVDHATDSAAAVLRHFGVTSADSTDVALRKLAEGLSKVENGAEKTAAVAAIFGAKLAAQLIPLLNAGAQGFDDAAEEARKFGLVVSGDAAKAAEDFNDNLTRVQKNMSAASMALAAELLPALRDLTNELVANIKQLGVFDGMLQTIWQAILGTDRERLARDGQKALDLLDELERRRRALDAPGMFSLPGVKERLDEQIAAQLKVVEGARKLLQAQAKIEDDAAKLAAKAAEGTGTGKLPKGLLDGKPKVPKVKEIKEAREELDEVAKALFKIGDEAAALDRVPLIMAAITDNLEKMTAAGLEGTTEFRLLKEKLLELEATTEPIARVTLELEKMHKQEDENAAIRLEALNRLQFELITEEEYARIVEAHGGKAAEAVEKTSEKVKTLSESLGEMSAKFAVDFIDRIIDDMGRAETSFGDMVETFLKQIAKLLVSQQLQQLLKLFEGMGTASGSEFGRWWEGLSTSAQGNAWSARGVEAMARGGILSRPTFFANGARLAVAGEAGPEAVVPLQRTAGGDLGVGASPVQVNIINNAGAEVTTATRDNEDGTRHIDVFIERKVKEMLSNGSMDRTMRNSYGLARQPTIG